MTFFVKKCLEIRHFPLETSINTRKKYNYVVITWFQLFGILNIYIYYIIKDSFYLVEKDQ